MERVAYSVLLAVLIGGCALTTPQRPQITLNVSARIDPDWAPNVSGATFAMVPVKRGTPDELLEKELLHYLRGRLALMGLVNDERAPQFFVGITAFIGPFEEYVPPTTFYWPMSTTSTTTSQAGSLSVTSTTHGEQYVPIQRPGYTRVNYFRSLTIFVGNPSPDGSGVSPVWQGNVDSAGATSDLLEVAPTLIRHLLTEFPRRSGYPSQRTTQVIRADDP
jgi:hypothetical protein